MSRYDKLRMASWKTRKSESEDNAPGYSKGSRTLSNGTTAYKRSNPDQHKAGRDGISITQRMKGSTYNGGQRRSNIDAEQKAVVNGHLVRKRNPTGRPATATRRGAGIGSTKPQRKK